MNALIPFLSLFAGPIGNLLNTGITAGASAFVAWSAAKGLPLADATTLATAGAALASAVVQASAGMIGVKIHAINAGDNGVKVVPQNANAPTVDAPLK